VTLGGTSPAISVVIPARDAAATLGAQLDALLAQDPGVEWEIVVADNGSRDGTRDLVERYNAREPRVRLVDASDRAGVSHTRNVGIRAARASHIAMCDADDVVAPSWLRTISRALEDHDFVGGPLELDLLNAPEVVETRGRALGDGPGDFGGVLAFAHSCNVGFHRELVDRCGGFDERLPAGEDVDLSLRFTLEGSPLFFEPEAVVHYRYRTGGAALYRQARSYGRVKAELRRRFAAAGLDVRDGGRAWRRAAWLVRHAGLLRDAAGRSRWLWTAGGVVGDVEGRVRLATRGARWT
jgi:glycosyltransferase involved in cell wall biosynthesis